MKRTGFTTRIMMAMGLLGASAGLAPGSTITESFDGVPSPIEVSGNGVLSVSDGALFGVLDEGSNHRTVTIGLTEGLMWGFELDLTNQPRDIGSGVNAWVNGQLVAFSPFATLIDGILRYEGTEAFSEILLTTNAPRYGGVREHFLLRSVTVWTIEPDLEIDPQIFLREIIDPSGGGPELPFGPEEPMARNPEPGTWLMAVAGLALVGIGRVRGRN